MKPNPWVWTKLSESKYLERKAGTPVSTAYLIEGYSEWYPRHSWISNGYVERRRSTSEQ